MNGQKNRVETLVTKKVSIVLPPNYKQMEPKDRILIKAEELFMQFGIRSVSMDDIANNLGMSKKTLYQYFADKDELVEAGVEGHINRVEGDCVNCRTEATAAIP